MPKFFYEVDKKETVSDVILLPDDSLFIHNGGTASYTRSSNGTVVVFGSAYDLWLSGGIASVCSGGRNSITVVANNGALYVYNHGFTSSISLYMTGGTMYLSGGTAFDNRVYSNGKMYVSSAGLASETSVCGGIMDVSGFAKATDTRISEKGVVHVYTNGVMKVDPDKIARAGCRRLLFQHGVHLPSGRPCFES